MKKRTRKKKDRLRSAAKGKPQGPFFFKHPLSELPREKLIPALIELGRSSKVRFHDSLERTLTLLQSAEPLQTIASLAVYGLFAGIASDGKRSPIHTDSRFGQAHVELVQALSLRLPQKANQGTPPDPSTIQNLFDVLPELGESFSLQRVRVTEEERSDQQKAITLLQEHLRMYTQSVRNWGYFDRVLRIVNELYRPLDNAFVDHLGIPATQIISAFQVLIRRTEEHVNARWDKFHQVFAERTVAGMVQKYYEVNPHFVGSADDLIAFATRENISVEQMKALMLSHSDLNLPDMFTFTAASISALLGVSKSHLEDVFRRLSLAFGDLAPHQPEFLLLDNPVWRKPLIALDQDRFFCATPQVFFSFVFPILDSLIAGNEALKRACEDRRAKFLEAEIARLFADAFPGAEIVTCFRWRDGPNEYENDLLIRIDSHLLIVEAKSGEISWPALRGAPERAKRHIEELFLAPSIQSARLAERIRTVVRNPELRSSYFPDLHLRLELVRTVLRLSVTLEDFAVIQSNLHILKGTGWIPENHALAPCILLADLEIVFEILEPKGQKVHYLRRRAELEEHMDYMGDELDLLGLYISTGFNLGDAEFGGQHLQLSGMSSEIDDYFIARAEGIGRPKPRLRLSTWWSDICSRMEQRNFYQWTDANNILLSFPPEEQYRAGSLFKKIRKNVRRNWRDPGHMCSVVMVPPLRKSDALALYAFRDHHRDRRRELMGDIASQVFNNHHVERCLVLAMNLDRVSYPYGTLIVFFSGEMREEARGEDLVVY
jgi:hypothetical protein